MCAILAAAVPQTMAPLGSVCYPSGECAPAVLDTARDAGAGLGAVGVLDIAGKLVPTYGIIC